MLGSEIVLTGLTNVPPLAWAGQALLCVPLWGHFDCFGKKREKKGEKGL